MQTRNRAAETNSPCRVDPVHFRTTDYPYRCRYRSSISPYSRFHSVCADRDEFHDSASIVWTARRASFYRIDRSDRRSIGSATRSPWRVTNPANHWSVIDIGPRGGYRADTIGSAPGVSPARTIYNVNIPEPGSTHFARPFPFVSFHSAIVLLVRCA